MPEQERWRAALHALDFGELGLTRGELRERVPELPETIYLHLPDSKRLASADAVLHEVARSSARAEGEFMAPDDNTPVEGAQADFGPAAYGESSLTSPSVVGPSTAFPTPGVDGNSLETAAEYASEE